MIDIQSEEVLSFADAARRLPRRRGGKRPNIATLYRWAARGRNGIVLETIQVGGTRCTSMEALQRFFNALTVPASTPWMIVSPAARRRHLQRVDRELDAAGF